MTDPSSAARHAMTGGRRSTRPVVRLAVDSVYRDMEQSVRTRLAELTEAAAAGNPGERAELGSAEVPKLVAALRDLLAEHAPDAKGRCRTCRKGWLRRKSASPCRGFLAAYLALVLSGDSAASDLPADARRVRAALRS